MKILRKFGLLLPVVLFVAGCTIHLYDKRQVPEVSVSGGLRPIISWTPPEAYELSIYEGAEDGNGLGVLWSAQRRERLREQFDVAGHLRHSTARLGDARSAAVGTGQDLLPSPSSAKIQRAMARGSSTRATVMSARRPLPQPQSEVGSVARLRVCRKATTIDRVARVGYLYFYPARPVPTYYRSSRVRLCTLLFYEAK